MLSVQNLIWMNSMGKTYRKLDKKQKQRLKENRNKKTRKLQEAYDNTTIRNKSDYRRETN